MSNSIKREKRPPSPEDDDVIILSDNDSPSPPMNGLSHFKELDTDLLMVRHTYTHFYTTETLAIRVFLVFAIWFVGPWCEQVIIF